MREKEHIRESVVDLPTQDYLRQRAAAGWKLVALEWERGGEAGDIATQPWVEEIPYGLQISGDCSRLVESPGESEVIVAALEMIVDDCPLSRAAEELNRRGYRTRDGKPWSAAALFDLLPRMIQVGPRVFSSEEWVNRRQRLPKVG